MGSSGTREIVARIVESFEGKPYRVIAPVKFQLCQMPNAHIPQNVLVTDWVPALQVNKMADLTVIHGGIGTVMTAALAGKPVVGVGMQMEQVANLACLERLGFAIRIRKSRNPSREVQEAIAKLLKDQREVEGCRLCGSRWPMGWPAARRREATRSLRGHFGTLRCSRLSRRLEE